MRTFVLLVQSAGLLLFSFVGYQDRPKDTRVSDNLYEQCSGNTFHPSDACANEGCVHSGLASTVFREWKTQFITTHKLSPEMFAKRIEISSVDLSEGPVYVWWKINYVFELDWVRSRQVTAVNLGNYPLRQEPDQSLIARRVTAAISEKDQLTIPEVVALSVAEKSLQSCDAGMKADWCHIRFENGTGGLVVGGLSGVDYARNKCKSAGVDLATGKLAYCRDTLCHFYL
jgi:hypothetical protein